MAWTKHLSALNQLLAEYFDEPEQAKRVAARAGIPAAYVGVKPRAVDTWYLLLVEADKRRKVDDVVRAALVDYPDDPLLTQALHGVLVPGAEQSAGLIAGATEVSDDEEIRAEALMSAQSSLLPISFLARGHVAARAVARIDCPRGNGTGFLTTENILVTNNHVLPTPADASAARVVFGHEHLADGSRSEGETVRLLPERLFLTSPQSRHDWTLVAVAADVNARYGALLLNRVDLASVKYVNIVQHPFGAPKYVALYHNVVVRYDDRLVHYLTDTNSGASGAPVFDSNWQVVALHRGHVSTTDRRSGRPTVRNVGTNINLVVGRVV